MRDKGATIQQLLLGLALLAALCWNLAHASELTGVRVAAGATGTRAELAVAAGVDYTVISLANPDRLVVDLRGVALGKGFKLPMPAGLVRAVRSGQPVPGTTRIVFDLASPVAVITPRIEDGPSGPRLVLEWPGDDAHRDPIARVTAASQAGIGAIAATATPPPAMPQAPTTTAVPASEAPAIDPAIASAAATARLVAATSLAQLRPPSALQAASAADPHAQAAKNTGSGTDPMPSTPPAAQLPTATIAHGTIATGVPTRIATGAPAPVASSTDTRTPATAQAAPRRMIGMRPLVVAIDPGHGGQDPGAIGLLGKREKDITLAIGRELARQINATPGLKAFLTRDSDVFIPLPRRAQLARAAKADIFVSIHADAAENRSARGSSVYVLSLKGASSQRARWLADKENAADLIGGRVATVDNT
ncbi:MAG: N-acetylmuramoyl-L-alanine amidase, partial [Luteimonas sp.]